MTEETRSRARVIGSLRTEAGKGAVRMEATYETDIDDLWSAITEPGRLARWIAVVEGDLSLGGAFRARFTSGWEGPGRVDRCEPPARLLLTMSPGTEDETIITAELAAEGDETRLVLVEQGIPVREIAAHGAGWQAHVEDLAAHVAGHEPTPWRERWVELTPSYREKAEAIA